MTTNRHHNLVELQMQIASAGTQSLSQPDGFRYPLQPPLFHLLLDRLVLNQHLDALALKKRKEPLWSPAL
ncbi:MAG: hypothetical protein AAB368_13710, partial [bacterium]